MDWWGHLTQWLDKPASNATVLRRERIYSWFRGVLASCLVAFGTIYPVRAQDINIEGVARSLSLYWAIVENVKGAVAPAKGSLLLGQSFLGRFRSWSIDNKTNEVLLNE
jgi:hypothetical protein